MLEIKKRTIIIFVMIGIVLSLSVSAIRITGFNGLGSFYNVGKVSDIPQSASRAFTTQGGHSDSDRNWFVEDDAFVRWIVFEKSQWACNYLYVQISNLEDEMEWILDYIDFTKEEPLYLVGEIHTVKNGMNQIPMPNVKFSTLGIRISNQQGLTFRVDMIQMRDNPIIPNFAIRMVKNTMFFLVIYCVLASLLLYLAKKMKWKLNFSKPIDMLQWFYMKAGNVALKVARIVPSKISGILTSLFWLAIIVYYNLRGTNTLIRQTHVQRTITISIILLCIAIFSLRKKLKSINWNTMLVKVWIVLSVMMIISDVVIKKTIMYQGLVMLLVFGFLTFVWNNMEHPAEMIESFMIAVHIYFVAITIFCLVCRPDVFPRYLGAFMNPVTFGTYAAIIAAVALVCMDNLVDKGKFSKAGFFYAVEFCISMVFVWKTGSRTALFPLMMIMGFIMVKHIIAWKRQGKNRAFLQTLLVILILAGPITIAMGWGLQNIPHMLNTKISFEGDIYEEESAKVESSKSVRIKPVQANSVQTLNTKTLSTKTPLVMNVVRVKDTRPVADNSVAVSAVPISTKGERRIWDKFTSGSLEDFTSGRTLIWRAYLREMNLFGHNNMAVVSGERKNAHSAFLMIPHRYGVFSIIPYIIMLALVLKKSLGYMYRGSKGIKREYALFPLAITMIFFSTALVDVAEYLYSSLIWVLFYWVMGLFFVEEESSKKEINN